MFPTRRAIATAGEVNIAPLHGRTVVLRPSRTAGAVHTPTGIFIVEQSPARTTCLKIGIRCRVSGSHVATVQTTGAVGGAAGADAEAGESPASFDAASSSVSITSCVTSRRTGALCFWRGMMGGDYGNDCQAQFQAACQ